MNEIVPVADAPTSDEGTLDPFVAVWMAANPLFATALTDLSPELLQLARSPFGAPPRREVGHVADDVVAGVPVRVYRPATTPTGVVVYFHGGGYCIGSVGLMDNVAREITHASGAIVVSVEYRLAPEHPYPAGLDDCDAVTVWALGAAADLGVAPGAVAVAGESAGGNLAAAVSLRRRDAGGPAPVAQVLIYPAVAGAADFPSRRAFDGLVISQVAGDLFWSAYSGDNDLRGDPYAVPLASTDLSGLPAALVVLGGCDMLRDEGRAYAGRLAEAGVDTLEISYAGQPHGFVNFDLPAAAPAHARIGTFLRSRFARPAGE